jgi:hypothetical protein
MQNGRRNEESDVRGPHDRAGVRQWVGGGVLPQSLKAVPILVECLHRTVVAAVRQTKRFASRIALKLSSKAGSSSAGKTRGAKSVIKKSAEPLL